MPVGIRGVGPQVAQRYWGLSRSDYFDRAEVWPVKPQGELLLIPMVETRKAVENIEKIVRVKGLSALMIGPGDMQVSFGHTKPYAGGGFPPDVEAAIQKVARAAREARVPFGITAGPNDVEASAPRIPIPGWGRGHGTQAEIHGGQPITGLTCEASRCGA
jgi:4-hydroxy-2-oxoheptanedioate aldolase